MDEPILISWIAEWKYCSRRFYLRVIENNQVENTFVAEGARDHERAHLCKIEKRKNLIKVTGLEVYSTRYNLFGVCDSVEFEISKNGVYIPFLDEKCIIRPVEYKHGKTRNEKEYNLQMAAQAICLEEMFQTRIEKGYVYYTGSKDRFEVILKDDLRLELRNTISEINTYLINPHPIHPELRKRCNGCSLKEICNPRNVLVEEYMKKIRQRYLEGGKR